MNMQKVIAIILAVTMVSSMAIIGVAQLFL
jgi:hypothetical protein